MASSFYRGLLRDFRGNLSWGRFCSFIALMVAVVAQFMGVDVAHIAMWLGIAVGNYGISKLSETHCVKSGEPGKTLF